MRLGGVIFSSLDSRSNDLGSSPGRGHCVVFLSKTLHSHRASLCTQVCKWLPAKFNAGGGRRITLRWTSIPSREAAEEGGGGGGGVVGVRSRNTSTPSRFMSRKPG